MTLIPQLDGHSEIHNTKEKVPSCLNSINCESQNVVTWITFFRSFDFLWKGNKEHCKCSLNLREENSAPCFFCLMRSTCARLSNRGKTGPKSIKPYDIVSELEQFKSIDGLNWNDENVDM
jgi:hypothetical protein